MIPIEAKIGICVQREGVLLLSQFCIALLVIGLKPLLIVFILRTGAGTTISRLRPKARLGAVSEPCSDSLAEAGNRHDIFSAAHVGIEKASKG